MSICRMLDTWNAPCLTVSIWISKLDVPSTFSANSRAPSVCHYILEMVLDRDVLTIEG